MIAIPDIEQIIGAEAVDPNNHKVGKVTQVYVDSETDQPTWASVRTGLFGIIETLVPLTNASWDHEILHIDVDKSLVKDAPRVDPESEISSEAQESLYEYYGMQSGTAVPADELGTGGPIGAGQVGMDAGVAGAGAAAHGRHAEGTTGTDAGGYDDRPAGPRFDRGQSAEADEPVDGRSDAGYGVTNDEPGGPDVRGSGRTAGDGLGSGDFASTGTALENDNPVAEEAAEGTGSGYGTSEDEDISGRFLDGRGPRGRDHGGRDRDEMREAGATPTEDRSGGQGMPGMAGGEAGAGSGAGTTTGTAGMQQQGGGMRLRRYVVSEETVVEPLNEQDELRMQPGAASSADDSSVGMRMDDRDPKDPGGR